VGTITSGPELVVQTHGDVSAAEREHARSKVPRLQAMAGAPVLFFVDSDHGRGHVLHRRFDGHYGMIVSSDE
jgi:hypothetical protein